MAITFQVTNGTTTVDCEGTNGTGTGAIVDYPMTPVRDDKATGEGAQSSVEETFRIRFRDTTLTAVIATVQALEKLISVDAPRYEELRKGARVYAKFRADSPLTLMQAIISGGNVKYDKDALYWQVRNNLFFVDVRWKRGEWRADAEVQNALLNGSVGSKTTSALTLYDHDDGGAGHDAYAEVDGPNDVGGVDNALIRFELARSSSGSNTAAIWMALGAYQDFANFPHVLEGESATSAVTLAATADANCSNGQYAAISGISAADCIAARWTLTAAQAAACAGQRYRLLARFRDLPIANTFVTPVVYPVGGVIAAQTGQMVTLNSTDALQDLGELRLPPWLPMETGSAGCDVVLLVHHTGGSGTLGLDFVALLPTEGFCFYKTYGAGLANTDLLIDDGAKEFAWAQTAAGAKAGIFERQGALFQLYPGRTQRVYAYALLADGTAPIATTHTLRIYRRERHPTL